ncbi:MAG TPA: MFS transporter [Actinomycetota bacterium]|jgi:predicted MFS family arabinose efflux permease|nr:MFS transporter [Actinomycetota bacterium]
MSRAPADRARVAVAAAFAVNGLAFGSWVSRVPAVRDGLGLTPSQLGLLLLCPGIGSLVGLPAAGRLVARIGPARAVSAGATGVALALVGAAAGLRAGWPLLAAAGLVVYGLGVSNWDVAMNVEGADVERRLARPLLPRLHAGFSLGSVAGAGAGALAAAAGVPVVAQLLATALVVLAAAGAAVRGFLPMPPERDRQPGIGLGRAWRERRTVLVGVMVLAFAFTEGVANDWLALALVDGHGASEAVGAVAFGVFVAALTAGRLVGGALLERAGRVVVLRGLAATAAAGVLLVVLAGPLPLALAGALAWGAGTSLGFPVGMSAAADEPAAAAARVSVVSSIGYTAFLAGPPLVGLLAGTWGVLTALLAVLVALLVGAVAAAATRPAGQLSGG